MRARLRAVALRSANVSRVLCVAVVKGCRVCRSPLLPCRASKAALNQLTKTMSLEFARRKTNVACVLLHPGTCDTGLSEPFQRNVPEGKLFSRERGARQLLELIDGVTMGNTGRFVAWDGQEIPW